MKKSLAILLTLIGLQAQAQQSPVTFVGNDNNGNACSVKIDLSNDNLLFTYLTNDGSWDGFGFSMTEALKTSLSQNQSPISISQGGLGGAHLKIWINSNGTMDAKFRNFLIFSATCENMHRKD